MAARVHFTSPIIPSGVKKYTLGGKTSRLLYKLAGGAVADNRFIMLVKSDNVGTSGADQFTIPTTGTGYNYNIETSDGFTATGITGDTTITFPSGAGTHEVRITGDFPKTFFNNVGDKLKVLEVLNWGNYGVSQTNQSGAFFGCENLTAIAGGGAWFDVVTNGLSMFRGATSLSTLPMSMDMPLLIIGQNMFFNNTSLAILPDSMNLPVLNSARLMFFSCPITALSNNITLPLLTNGIEMFRNCNLLSLPTGMTLPALTNGFSMFLGNTINTPRYSQLLVDMESGNPNNNVPFHGGNSKYNATGETARNILTGATRLWTITDGGLE